MEMIFSEIKQKNFLSSSQPPFFHSQTLQPPPPPNLDSNGIDLDSTVSSSLLLIIMILAIIFFVSGLLHLLVRYLLMPPNVNPDDLDSVTALQGQLQQLFHLHDAGVDQSFIDTLPVFHYKTIIGLKNPFDCAVCLCEFECEDKLRLLPKCSHAFHMECIDTWLLSHSTCPLCRASLLPDFSPNNGCSPVVSVLESGSESSREILPGRNSAFGAANSSELGSSRIDLSRKSCENPPKDDSNPAAIMGSGGKVVPVKLGKFKNVDGGDGEGSCDNNADTRRCFSMGHFEYVMDDKSSLQVSIRTPVKKQSSKKPCLPLTPGHRPAMSECDFESRREFNGFDAFRCVDIQGSSSRIISNGMQANGIANAIGRSKRESFSVSKIWMRGKKDKANSLEDSSRRAFSFRFPPQKSVAEGDDLKINNGGGVCGSARRTKSEVGMARWENGGSELGCDEENQSCNSLDSQAKTPSFARRTLLWLVGRQSKVVHSSFSGPHV